MPLTLDISVNKPVKNFLRGEFQEWYSKQVVQQLEGEDIETCELKPIDLNMSVLKKVGAQLVEMVNYFEDNLVNGFLHSWITGALDGVEDDGVEDKLLRLCTDLSIGPSRRA